MIGKLFEFPVRFRPFHSDGCNGTAGIGELIILLWFVSLLLLSAIVVTLHFGYLEIERTPVAWGLAVGGIAALPALVAYPLLKTRNALYVARSKAIGQFEPILTDLHFELEQQLRTRAISDARLDEIERAEQFYQLISEANVWPFSRNITAAIFFANVLQFVVLAKALLGGGL